MSKPIPFFTEVKKRRGYPHQSLKRMYKTIKNLQKPETPKDSSPSTWQHKNTMEDNYPDDETIGSMLRCGHAALHHNDHLLKPH